jgi:hypothetical protein
MLGGGPVTSRHCRGGRAARQGRCCFDKRAHDAGQPSALPCLHEAKDFQIAKIIAPISRFLPVDPAPSPLTLPQLRSITPHMILSRTVMAGCFAIGLAIGGVGFPHRGAAQSSSDDATTACQKRLTAAHALFKPLGEFRSPAGCGGTDFVYLERIVLPNCSEIAVEPPATLRCEMAETLVSFVRHDLVPAAATMGTNLSAIENYDSYDCRGRNRVIGAKMSEHGLGNAFDIRSVRLKNGRVVHPTDADAPHPFRLAMKAAVCNRFSTVLGPGSDGYHEDHIHMDIAERDRRYNICHWNLHEGSHAAVAHVAARTSAEDAAPARAIAPNVPAAAPSRIPLPRSRPFSAGGGRVPAIESHDQ